MTGEVWGELVSTDGIYLLKSHPSETREGYYATVFIPKDELVVPDDAPIAPRVRMHWEVKE